MSKQPDEYDKKLLQLGNFKNLPETLPFIGQHWHKQHERILFIAESHYVDTSDFECQPNAGKTKLNIANPDDFYTLVSDDLYDGFKAFFNTRAIIKDVEEGKNLKGKQIYTNLKRVLAEYAGLSINDKVFSYFSVYNYFQRPSYTNSGTIQNTKTDNTVAFETFIHVIDVLKPTIVFFISAKAHNVFLKSQKINNWKDSEIIKVYSAPHPARAWWNRPSPQYNNMSGKNFMKFILSSKDKIII